MHNINTNSISHDEITAFVLNELKGEHREKIEKAINTNEIIKEMFLLEKRQYDVERYLDKEMSIGENCEFEELLIKNPSLKEHFILSKDIDEFLNIEAIRNQFDMIHHELYGIDCNYELDEKHEKLYSSDNIKKHDKVSKELRQDENTVPVIKMKSEIFKIGKWVAAASLVFMIGFTGANMYLKSKNSMGNRLYEKHYERFKNNTKNYYISSPILKAKKMYSKNESGNALLILQNTPSLLNIETEKNLYLGLTFMELERYNEAIELFKAIQNDDEMIILSISQWYLALSYLATEEKYEAITILEEIVENKSYKHNKASKILKKLI
ncbi:MAG: hypothetical protein GQ564_17290 [Bacteroidales bacterium]|nr:hypothetical protein [Bacteroidales bacterium]